MNNINKTSHAQNIQNIDNTNNPIKQGGFKSRSVRIYEAVKKIFSKVISKFNKSNKDISTRKIAVVTPNKLIKQPGIKAKSLSPVAINEEFADQNVDADNLLKTDEEPSYYNIDNDEPDIYQDLNEVRSQAEAEASTANPSYYNIADETEDIYQDLSEVRSQAEASTKNPSYYNIDDETEEIYVDLKEIATEDKNNLESPIKESIYGNVNIDESPKNETDDEIYVNMSAIRNQMQAGISETSKSSIRQDMQAIRNFLPKETSRGKSASASTDYMFKNEIKVKDKVFGAKEIIKADGKYRDIKCTKHSSATKGNIYHANKYGDYIAAQGPYTKHEKANEKNVSENTAGNFIAMLAETQSPVSVSLVNKDEFIRSSSINDKIPPDNVGEILEIPEQKLEGKIIREKTTIEKLDEVYYEDIGLQVDTFSINGKTHVRVYDLDWPDKTPGDPQRLAAIALFTEKLRQLPELEDRKDNKLVINCNAGVGRTGTYMMIHSAIVKYTKDSQMPTMNDVKQEIIKARANRSHMVQISSQLETINSVINNPEKFVQPLAGKFAL